MQKLIILAATAALFSSTAALAQGDECTGAIALVDGANGPFSNAGSTTSAPAWPCAAGGNDVWFFYVATCTGTVTVDTCGGGYDSCIEAFSGGCGGLTSLACDDDGCVGIALTSRLTFSATSGVTYNIRLGGFGGAVGSTNINVACQAPQPNQLVTTYANNNGGAVGGGVYFDLVINVPLTITQAFGNVTGTGSVNVLAVAGGRTAANMVNRSAWTLLGSGTVTGAVAGAVTPVVGLPPIPLAPGTYGIAFEAVGVSHNYTNGTGTNQTYSTPEMTLNAGEASNAAFVAPLFTPRVVNGTFNYSLGTSGTVAVQQQYGNSCYSCNASIYDNRAAATTALNGQNLQFAASGGGYVVTHAGSYAAPGGGAVALALTDDSEVTMAGALGSYTVCSNGYISAATGNGTAFTPSTATLLNGPQTAFYLWHDYNPAIAGSGPVVYELVGGVDTFTWNGVWDFGGTSAANANTIQFRYYPGGNVELSIVTMSGLGNGLLAGYSPGGANTDPGTTDLTTLTSVTLCATDTTGIALGASARPLSGSTINLNTSNVPAAATLSILLVNFSAVIPGIELSGNGMPNCYQNIALLGAVTLAVNIGNGSWSQPFGIPAGASYLGTNVFGQTAALVPGANAFGATSSNGLRLTVGNL